MVVQLRTLLAAQILPVLQLSWLHDCKLNCTAWPAQGRSGGSASSCQPPSPLQRHTTTARSRQLTQQPPWPQHTAGSSAPAARRSLFSSAPSCRKASRRGAWLDAPRAPHQPGLGSAGAARTARPAPPESSRRLPAHEPPQLLAAECDGARPAAPMRMARVVRDAGAALAALQRGVGTALPWRSVGRGAVAGVLVLTTLYTVHVHVLQLLLSSAAGNLASGQPALQRAALSQLRRAIALDVARQNAAPLVTRVDLTRLAALLAPGTDAFVVQEACVMLQELLTAYGEPMRQALLAAGVGDALACGLVQGGLPRGAAPAASSLQRKLRGAAAEVGR